MACGTVHAQSALAPYVEHEKRLRAAQEVAPLKSDLFGDSISLYNGAVEFAVTDIDLPGNNGLPVQLRRRFKVETTKEVEPLGGFGVWELDVPYLYGTFASAYKWTTSANGVVGRCSENWLPKVNPPFTLKEIWHGNMMHMPGAGDTEVLVSSIPAPSDGQTYTRAASDFYRFRCKSTTANGYPGEGFIAVDKSGTKYTFDVGTERGAGAMQMPGAASGRTKVYLLVSRIEDRFGNWVNYTYAGDRLTAITASDGRSITIEWSGRTIVKASANGRDWFYTYSGDTGYVYDFVWLETVTLPDATRYKYSYQSDSPFGVLNTNYTPLDSDPAWCDEPDFDPNSFTMIATHPSGAVGTFYIPYQRMHRSGTPKTACVRVSDENYQLRKADYFDLYSIQTKTITGPGIPSLQWTYTYGDRGPGRTTATIPCWTLCATEKAVIVTQPDGSQIRNRFGILYAGNEGRLLGTKTVAPDGTVVRTQATTYVSSSEAASMPFPNRWGDWTGADDAGLALDIRPVKQTTTTQDGVTFSNTVTSFDGFVRPVTTVRENSLGYSRTEQATYQDNLTKWILGQVKSVTQTNPGPSVVMSQTDYDAADLPWRQYSFGLLQQTLTYNADGTLATVNDGKGNATSLSNWKRGVPQKIQYADTTSQTAVIDDNGWIKSIADENSYVTKYDYDAMGRVALVDYPDNDSVNWSNTVSSFAPVAASEYGLASGHWKHVVSSGNARKITYFDAFWRPVVEEQYDAGNTSGTLSQIVKRYDANDQQVFQSYPLRGLIDYAAVAQGARTSYDALDRVTRVEQDSELGVLVTKTDYLAGLQVRVTNPRLNATTTTYMAYDQPSLDWPVLIAQPEGIYTDIVRDAFGKPLSVRRRNADATTALTRQFVYDGYQRLCKTIEPETGAAATAYDAAGNIDWSASGLNLTEPANCNATEAYNSGRRVQRAYDSKNRIATLQFPDGSGNQSWEYWPDGPVRKVTTYNNGVAVTNDYTYNKRRLLGSESTSEVDGKTWGLGYGYSANGHLASSTYPSGLLVDYAPNALGQPTQAGSYAAGVSYYPNGAMAQFTYGNGIVHTLVQNTRGLPDRSLDAYAGSAVLDDSYDYDANGNVAAISDGLSGNRGNRDMTYDGLDRLKTTSSPMFSSASYTYDVLDNIKALKVAGRDHTYVYDPTNRLTNVMAGSSTVVGLGYDAQGNLSNKSGQIFVFDYGNRLRTAPGETYRYDGHGRRIQATHTTKGTILSMYGQDGTLRYQHNEREAKAYDYITLNGSLVAKVSNVASPAAPVVEVPGYSTDGAYTVSWSAVTGATFFKLEESIGGAPWKQAYTGSERSRSLAGRGNDSFSYRAQACNTAGCGPWSVVVTVFVQRPPVSPLSITVPEQGASGQYTVSWKPPMVAASSDGSTPNSYTGVSTYTLEERFNDGAWGSVHSDGATTLNHAFTGKAAGSYTYRVKACNPYGCSGYVTGANAVVVVYPPVAPPLSMPASLLTGSYTVSWSAVSSATSYHLDENFNGGTWGRVHNTTATSGTVSGRQTGTYGYRVFACNAAGCSPASAAVSVQVTVPPPTAPGLSGPGTNSNGSYSLHWNGVATATYYQLVERLNGGGFGLVYSGGDGGASVSGRGNGTWEYMARACNAAGCGPYSGLVAVQVLLPPPVPLITSAVSTKTTSSPYRVTCSVNWNAAPTATSYELIGDTKTWSLGNVTSVFSSTGNYCATRYQLRACNSAGCSAWSAPMPQRVEIIPTGPGGDPW